jgi:hypothetical protein
MLATLSIRDGKQAAGILEKPKFWRLKVKQLSETSGIFDLFVVLGTIKVCSHTYF